jgi:hypothetical protein
MSSVFGDEMLPMLMPLLQVVQLTCLQLYTALHPKIIYDNWIRLTLESIVVVASIAFRRELDKPLRNWICDVL